MGKKRSVRSVAVTAVPTVTGDTESRLVGRFVSTSERKPHAVLVFRDRQYDVSPPPRLCVGLKPFSAFNTPSAQLASSAPSASPVTSDAADGGQAATEVDVEGENEGSCESEAMPTALREIFATPNCTPSDASPLSTAAARARDATVTKSSAKVLMWATPAARLAQALDGDNANLADLLELERRQMTQWDDVVAANPSMTALAAQEIVAHVHSICAEFFLRQVTFHLAVNMIFRVLASEPVPTADQQRLYNFVCVLIAAKLEEEVIKLDVNQVSQRCGCGVTDVFDCERNVSEILQFRLAVITQASLLETLFRIAKFNTAAQQLASLLSDVTLFYVPTLMLAYTASQLASAVTLLTAMVLKAPRTSWWTGELRSSSGYSQAQLAPIAREIAAVVEASKNDCCGLWRHYDQVPNGSLLAKSAQLCWKVK